MIKTSDGNLVLSGTSVSFETDTDILIEKLDINGNQLWEKIYGGENSETGQSIKEVTSEGYVVGDGEHPNKRLGYVCNADKFFGRFIMVTTIRRFE
ncbi:MAG: hypothetical protein IPL67_10360 [Ignavibacteria bacterium]|nr:hypothetical protein [Ignavibacteria bacterium]